MNIATPGLREVLAINQGLIFPENYIFLMGAAVAGQGTGLRKASGVAGYSPSGVTFVPMWYRIYFDQPGSASKLKYKYCDNDVGIDTATSPTNAVNPGGDDKIAVIAVSASTGVQEGPMSRFPVVSGKFFYVNYSGSGNMVIHVWGKEV